MPLPFDFDFRNPDYLSVFKLRAERLNEIRKNPDCLPALKAYYRENPADFIDDWGMTFDPRNIEKGQPSNVPFILFPKQRDWINTVVEQWKSQTNGINEKSRDMGLSWLSIALGCTLCLFNEGMVVGFGSRKEEYVDKIGSPKSLFWKGRMFLKMLPPEFRGGFNEKKHAPHMRINIPETGASISGESGDGIGRGDRTSIYFVDESAFLERPHLVEASLSQTTNCRQDISTPNGMANPFAVKRHSGRFPVFTFHWRDDPRKDESWYQKQQDELDPVTLAQEVDLSYSASVEGIVIPNEWVRAAIGANEKFDIEATGEVRGALDVADEGSDKNGFCGAKGNEIRHISEWSGKGSDIYATVVRAFNICEEMGIDEFRYDADGLGAGVRGDARVINEKRIEKNKKEIDVFAFRGSGAIVDPEEEFIEGRTNQDLFANLKAQGWWMLRKRFQHTYRAVNGEVDYDPDEGISIPEWLENKDQMINELSQPTYTKTETGKIKINKKPKGAKSPNLADSVMMMYAPFQKESTDFFDVEWD